MALHHGGVHRFAMAGTIAGIIGLAVAAGLAVHGYVFGVGDMAEVLPQVRHMLDPTHLAADWLVDATTGLGASRGWFVALMALAVSFLGEQTAFWLAQLAILAALGGALFAWTWLRSGMLGAAAASAVVVTTIDMGTLGRSALLTDAAVPSTLAWAGIAWALVAADRRRWFTTGLLVAATTFIHPQLGVGGAALVGGWLLLRGDLPSRRAWCLLFVGWMPSLVVLVPTVLGQLGSSVPAEAQLRILVEMRNPWHYLPSTWLRTEWFSFAAGIATAAILIIGRPRLAGIDRLLALLVPIIALGYLLTEVVPVMPFVKLQPFRLTVIVQLVIALGAGAAIGRLWVTWHGRAIALTMLLLLTTADVVHPTVAVATVLAAILARVALETQRPGPITAAVLMLGAAGVATPAVTIAAAGGEWAPVTATVIGVAAVGLAHLAAGRSRRIVRPAGRWLAASAAGGLAAVVLVMLSAIAFDIVRPPEGVRSTVAPMLGTLRPSPLRPATPLDDIANWARATTDADAVFIVPPLYSEFRVRSERAIVVDFKAFVFDPDGMVEWLERMQAIAGRSLSLGAAWAAELDAAYRDQTAAGLSAAARRYGADYVVLPVDHSAAAEFRAPAYANDRYGVHELGRAQAIEGDELSVVESKAHR